MIVKVLDGDIDRALRELKKKIGRDGIHTQISRRGAFPKPSDRRRAKEIIAARRRIERERKKEWGR